MRQRYKAESLMKDNQIKMLEANMEQQVNMLKEAASHWRSARRCDMP